MKETISSYEDLLDMLDSLLREPTQFWDDFYSNREKGVPFFTNKPDENLVNYFEKKLLNPGKVLELGCGPGRNAIYFAEKGCLVDAVDLSQESIQWATERAKEKNVNINFIYNNIFDLQIEEGTYDIVYDSGCFHHIAPHRRMSYIDLVKKALKPGGYFAITCFVQGGELGGADITDWEVYKLQSLKGGLGFTDKKLRAIFKGFSEVEIRRMKEIKQSNKVFGVSGLWTALFTKSSTEY
ncbi:class I SAM-dependent methyltransferase [Bacillus pseudomycoides]|uniref:class I SAM-dependent methyltransferase n=1 Tax=Bacillus pseudomycoides TaxID=64104 RepID=UPI000BEB446D|nr:class I SAM-dependent methyltransferase [Bacillus pseudomycoides]PDY46648.1 SAM-dependent methyltransferase [Bacillus pseudomycoides]PED08157.1 SAM-dependent methyltransferase [Bacillus pseudomycoides]PED70011.1 SAM-dependent methyltransferase [Bacillus pseudomycoides]PEI46617.1 SAM-dependent methyltransferase [Bacillus pseudomycoides]PEJ78639.1 SAM-dependent methyltransferase [Bacillus pseudomycoides]